LVEPQLVTACRIDDADNCVYMGGSNIVVKAANFSSHKFLDGFYFSWGRWADIQRHGHFKRKLEVEDIRTISRAMASVPI
jgi:hypothetical protein